MTLKSMIKTINEPKDGYVCLVAGIIFAAKSDYKEQYSTLARLKKERERKLSGIGKRTLQEIEYDINYRERKLKAIEQEMSSEYMYSLTGIEGSTIVKQLKKIGENYDKKRIEIDRKRKEALKATRV